MTHLSASDHAQADPTTPVPASGPIPFSDRIAAMDLARGSTSARVLSVEVIGPAAGSAAVRTARPR